MFNEHSDGTMTFDISGATSFGTVNLTGGTFNLSGGTANPVLQGGYAPPVGTTFNVINGTNNGGAFATVKNNFHGSYSPTVIALVRDKDSTAVSVSSNNNPSTVGQSVKFTATITPGPGGVGNPTGTVTFFDNGSSIGTGSVSTTGGVSTATLTTSTLTVGTHPITAQYGGDANYGGSPMSSPALSQKVNAASTTTTTTLSGGGQSGTSITVPQNTAVTDQASLSGTSASGATGTVTYTVYSDASCTTKVAGGTAQSITTPGTLPASSPVSLSTPGTYYWVASYSGDTNNVASASKCGSETETVTSPVARADNDDDIALRRRKERDEHHRAQEHAGERPGHPDRHQREHGHGNGDLHRLLRRQLHDQGGRRHRPVHHHPGHPAGLLAGEPVHPGDLLLGRQLQRRYRQRRLGVECGAETETVSAPAATSTTTTTSLTGGGHSGTSITVPENTPVTDQASLTGTNASSATGTITYTVYSDANCTTKVAGGTARPSPRRAARRPPRRCALSTPGTYYWVATYSGDTENVGSHSGCGAETETVSAPAATSTTTTTSLTGGGHSGTSITVPENTPVTDQASLTGTNASSATGTITYTVYSDANCTTKVAGGTAQTITTAGSPPASSAVSLTTPGTYYWVATYSGDTENVGSHSGCGAETETVSPPPGGASCKITSTHETPAPATQTVQVTDAAGVASITYHITNGTVAFSPSPVLGPMTTMGSTVSQTGTYSTPYPTTVNATATKTNQMQLAQWSLDIVDGAGVKTHCQ